MTRTSPAPVEPGLPRVSVVVASQNARTALAECLDSLRRQDPQAAAEVIVADNSRDGSAEMVRRQFPAVRLLEVSGRALIPELWAAGAAVAAGPIVAFTSAECVPGEQWLARVEAHLQDRRVAAVGGAITNRVPSPWARWAIYLMRYAAYAPPIPTTPVRQIAADNAAYRRWAVESYASDLGGFWENVVNNRLVREGHALRLAPDLDVEYAQAPDPWTFCRQRYRHGVRFGRHRLAAGRPRWLAVAASPFVPWIYLARISRAAMRRNDLRRELLPCLPLVLLFVVSWSLGEFVGYLGGSAAAVSRIRIPPGAPAVRETEGQSGR